MSGYSARRRLLAVVVAVLTIVGLSAPLAAQTTDAEFEVLRIDMRQGDSGLITVRPGPTSESGELVVSAGDGNLVQSVAPIARSPINGYTVLVVDNSITADQVVGFSSIRESALTYLDGVAADTRVMLVAAGTGNPEIRPLVPFTVDHQLVREALNAMRVESSAVTWNAIAQATNAFLEEGDGIRNVVAFAASPGTGSTVSSTAAQGNLLNATSSLTVIAPEAVNLDLRQFESVASSMRGGAVFRANDSSTMSDAARAAARVHENTLVAQFDTSRIPAEASALDVSYGTATERVRFTVGGIATGAGLTAPELPTPSRFDVLQGDRGALIAIGLGVVATLLFSYALMSIVAGTDNSLNSTLAVYGHDEQDVQDADSSDAAFSSVRSKIVEQVVETAEAAAESRGSLQTTTTMLEKAEIPLRVGEAMAVQVGIIVAAMAAGFVLFGSPIGSVILAIPAALVPTAYVKYKVKKRKKKLESQLPDTLNLLSSTLKAGYSFIQGIDAVGNEADEPLAGEFRRTVNEARLGKDIDDALDDLGERVDSIDLQWAIVAIKIQREVGGNLAELLSTVAETMTARSRLRGEVAALTAEGRMSAWVLVFLPIGVGVAMYFMNPDYISTLWDTTEGYMGYIAMGLGALGMVVGTVWMRKIIDIKI